MAEKKQCMAHFCGFSTMVFWRSVMRHQVHEVHRDALDRDDACSFLNGNIRVACRAMLESILNFMSTAMCNETTESVLY
ncbi:hypothetical protein LPH50_01980 [Xylella taiwanensis]|uniref:Uncharacterized protein n=1 Tax=Xylella taiwanensis TaxID=1444770 RepID=Z9JHX6_9GAMM|nr:hypothetical protein [Xylella taiwanensis]AXI83906.1 hypothetical protein AB672_08150 [Xylella taiwanensis]EWS77583.1 hypothetical protein AF72_09830 [Xylella taiwanensis]MCD8459424.1 hypothetical protein [Xylella taiwanensis]MCD8462262.1 hypothetical protein [Xylella taiwanensis]MCD8469030.1 hypothetical protein [Xylella taiwanensis]